MKVRFSDFINYIRSREVFCDGRENAVFRVGSIFVLGLLGSKKLGAHPASEGREKGVYFAVWAPNAQAVSVVGDFNKWNTKANPMKKAY